MSELISESGANLVVGLLSIILMIVGTVAGAVNGKLKVGVLAGIGLALLNLGLWWMYNAIVRAAGLDSFWALVGQMVFFAAIGAAIGIGSARCRRR